MQSLFDSSTHKDFNYVGRLKWNIGNGGLNIKKLTDVLTLIYKEARATIPANPRKKYKARAARVTTLGEVTAELPIAKGNNLKLPVETGTADDVANNINLLRAKVKQAKDDMNDYLNSLIAA